MYQMISVDAWAEGSGWTWNNWHPLGDERFAEGSLPETVEEFIALMEEHYGLIRGVNFKLSDYELDIDNNCEHGNVTLCEIMDEENDEDEDDEPRDPRPIYSLIWAGED